MRILYIYIPAFLEAQIKELQEAWLSSSPNAYTIIVGEYKPTEEGYKNESTGIQLQGGGYIPRYTQDLDISQNSVQKLASFCLKLEESNLLFIPSALISLCRVFDNPKNYLAYINTLE